MIRTEKKAYTRAAAAKLQELKNSELKEVSGALKDCCNSFSYRTGNYRKRTVGFMTLAEYEYVCPICKEIHWQTEIELFN